MLKSIIKSSLVVDDHHHIQPLYTLQVLYQSVHDFQRSVEARCLADIEMHVLHAKLLKKPLNHCMSLCDKVFLITWSRQLSGTCQFAKGNGNFQSYYQ